MQIVWDEPKRRANIAKHGYDFADFDTCFDATDALFRPARPSRTGRSRILVIGAWEDRRVVAVVVSPLGSEALSLVSLRTASPKERDAYDRHRAEARGDTDRRDP